jgi:hypothetical protein
MWRWLSIGSARPPTPEGDAASGSRRDRLAVLLALATAAGVGAAFLLAKDTYFLMPGPLASAHGSIENCSACHTKSGSGKLSWIRGLFAGDRLADSKACLTCHNMPDTAFNAHSASAEVLNQSTKRLTKIAAEIPVPQSARAQSIAFPTDGVVERGLYCATCHQEHQGANFKLSKISNEQCRSCHVVKFDSFDGHHPKFENYPFKQRTRIIYDHAGHFGKHFPETAKTDPARRIPETCSSCHNSRKDKRVMAVAPFEQTCTGCHLDQITGKERVSGPKGIAFLALPGLDLQTLKRKKASIGEWPDASEAVLTPFMKVMISRHERGRALIKTVDSLNLQDLSGASDAQIKAVTTLVWEIKGLFHALIQGKASDVMGDLNIGSGAKLSAGLVADLTASIPRDVVISAHQQWLPNLATEMANRAVTGDQDKGGGSATIPESISGGSAPLQTQSGSDARRATSKLSPQAVDSEAPQPKAAAGKADTANAKPDVSSSPERPSESDARRATPNRGPEPSKARRDPQACIMAVFGQCLVSKGPEQDLPPALRAGLKEVAQVAQLEGAAGKTKPANAKPAGGKESPPADEKPPAKAADQADDLLFPTEEELRAMKGGAKDAKKAAPPEGAGGKADTAKAAAHAPADARLDSGAPTAKPQARAAPVISIESNVDPESWAAYGGWYRQDYTIFYRPTGHKDKFNYTWLYLTGPQAPKGDTSPAAAVFDFLTSKDAQGSCTKCHSVDDIRGKGRVVNFSPPSVESKQGRFTNFIHEPHFGIQDNRGCLTCHSLEKGRPYLTSYEQGNPQNFASNFGAVKKDLCQTCHTGGVARQDCLLCHKYHVNGVITPIMNTRLPAQ